MPNSVDLQKESSLDKAVSQEVELFFDYLHKDKEIKYIEIGRDFVKYGIKNYTAEVTFKIKKNG